MISLGLSVFFIAGLTGGTINSMLEQPDASPETGRMKKDPGKPEKQQKR